MTDTDHLQVADLVTPLNVTVNAPAYTVFAPTDEAFTQLLAARNITGLDNVPQEFLDALPMV